MRQTQVHSMILVINSGNQFSIFVAWPRFGGRNKNVLAMPCMLSSSKARICRRPGPWVELWVSSTVLRVDADPLVAIPRPGSSIATRKTVDTADKMVGLVELAKVS